MSPKSCGVIKTGACIETFRITLSRRRENQPHAFVVKPALIEKLRTLRCQASEFIAPNPKQSEQRSDSGIQDSAHYCASGKLGHVDLENHDRDESDCRYDRARDSNDGLASKI